MSQNLLAGNALWSDGNRIASASIRNITKPRKASIDVTRVGADTATAGRRDTVETGADTVECMVLGILIRVRSRSSIRWLVSMILCPALLDTPIQCGQTAT